MTAFLSNLLVLGGLIWSAVAAVRLMRTDGPRLATRNSHSDSGRAVSQSVFGPLLVVWLGFLLSGATRSWWSAAVLVPVGGLTILALELLRTVHGNRRETRVAGPATAVVLLTATLTLLGMLLAVRLVVAPDPAEDLLTSIDTDAAVEIARSVWAPLLLIGTALLGLRIALRRNGDAGDERFTDRDDPAEGGAAGRVRSISRWWESNLPWWGKQLVRVAVLLALGVTPGLLGGLRLTVGPVATPEFAKVLYLWFLAIMLAQLSPRFIALNAFRVVPPLHVAWPIMLFLTLAVGSVARSDVGPLIPAFVASLMMLIATIVGVAKARATSTWSTLRRTLVAASPFVLPTFLLVVVFYSALRVTGYISQRFVIWEDPWIYSWASPCIPAEPPPGLTLPPGTTGCQEALSTYVASRSSQIAQSLAAVADGGLWGRGLGDTVTGRIPAGSTDFILAIMWNKLGGLTVLAATALVVLLAVAVVRTENTLRAGRRTVDAVALFAVGVAAALVGQHLFVLASTVNALPHSGITAPLLSRGGQSTLALVLAITAAVALSYRSRSHRSGFARPASDGAGIHRVVFGSAPGAAATPAVAGARIAPPAVALLIALTLAGWVIVVPYSGHAENLPYCADGSARFDPDACSTDRFRIGRMPVQISVGGVPQYRRGGAGEDWTPLGEPVMSPDDLAGLLDLGTGPGVVDLAFLQEAVGSRVSGPLDRLLPPLANRRPDSEIDLTVDPTIQHAVAGALRTAHGSPALAGGTVVMDARTGAVLAAAGAPSVSEADEEAVPDVARDAQIRAFNRANRFGLMADDGTVDATSGACTDDPDPEIEARCRQWVAQPVATSSDDSALRRYVGGDPAVDLPSAVANRGLGARYQPGSTFKVVVAMAYLRTPGASLDRLLPAPLAIPRPGAPAVHNAGDGPCQGADSAGMITLTRALAFSCNTAFVRLAEEVGWDKIRQTALDLGFDTARTGRARMAGPRTGVASVVPDDGGDLANSALGAGDVAATPLQMASVMATAANGGTSVAPSLVSRARSAADGRLQDVSAPGRQVMTRQQAGLVLEALSETARIGTARKLEVPKDHDVWVKTGTHEIFPEGQQPHDRFVRQYSWLVGVIGTGAGPVAFATALEGRDEVDGRRRAFEVTQTLLKSVVEARG
jgi:cell division protein FtsW (lipid II flippase)